MRTPESNPLENHGDDGPDILPPPGMDVELPESVTRAAHEEREPGTGYGAVVQPPD